VSQNFEKIVAHIRKVAPKAKVVIVSYPAVLPVSGNCRATGISDQQAQISRDVARRLAAITKQAAAKAGAAYVDMATASVGHDACSSQPWTNGAIVEQGTAFHPNAAGAAAVAERVAAVMRP
jgi:lysophospholipase L1-like esterase